MTQYIFLITAEDFLDTDEPQVFGPFDDFQECLTYGNRKMHESLQHLRDGWTTDEFELDDANNVINCSTYFGGDGGQIVQGQPLKLLK